LLVVVTALHITPVAEVRRDLLPCLHAKPLDQRLKLCFIGRRPRAFQQIGIEAAIPPLRTLRSRPSIPNEFRNSRSVIEAIPMESCNQPLIFGFGPDSRWLALGAWTSVRGKWGAGKWIGTDGQDLHDSMHGLIIAEGLAKRGSRIVRRDVSADERAEGFECFVATSLGCTIGALDDV
jgi:hypothetical protein